MKRALALLLVAGCAGDADDTGTLSDDLIADNGVSLNGVSLNGVSLNGVSLNGVSLNGVSLNGATSGGTTLTGLKVTNSQLSGVKGTTTLSGTAMVNSLWNVTLSNGKTTKIQITSAATGAAPNTDVWMYGVNIQTDQGFIPMCGSGILAIAVNGTFNNGQGVTGGGSFTASTTSFTFGCRGAAIAKCVEWGYKPWKTVSSVNLTNHHVACTRMVRADYCGNGNSYTINGTAIDLYDALAIQADTAAWKIEAEWTANGARCIKNSTYTRGYVLLATVPSCLAAITTTSCGQLSDFSSGALLMDEYVQ
jgi:ADYC domain-containing protein/pentapeptide repeat protein